MRDWLLQQSFLRLICTGMSTTPVAMTTEHRQRDFRLGRCPLFCLARARGQGPLTSPEGNGWIVRGLLTKVGAHVRTGVPVARITPKGRNIVVLAAEAAYHANAVIFAAPTFLARYLSTTVPPSRFNITLADSEPYTRSATC